MTKIKRLNVSLIITVLSLIILYKQRKRIQELLDHKKERRGIEILARLLFNINNMTNEKNVF